MQYWILWSLENIFNPPLPKEGGTSSVYFYSNDCFDVHIFNEFSFEKAIHRGLLSQRLKQQVDYI
jgi:hypothetical protein